MYRTTDFFEGESSKKSEEETSRNGKCGHKRALTVEVKEKKHVKNNQEARHTMSE